MKKRCLVNSIWIPILSIWKENKLFSNHTAREVTNVLMHTSSKKVYQEDCNWCFKKFFCILNWNVKGVIPFAKLFSLQIWRNLKAHHTWCNTERLKKLKAFSLKYSRLHFPQLKISKDNRFFFLNSFDMKGCTLQF
jgi:hypothetical protein